MQYFKDFRNQMDIRHAAKSLRQSVSQCTPHLEHCQPHCPDLDLRLTHFRRRYRQVYCIGWYHTLATSDYSWIWFLFLWNLKKWLHAYTPVYCPWSKTACKPCTSLRHMSLHTVFRVACLLFVSPPFWESINEKERNISRNHIDHLRVHLVWCNCSLSLASVACWEFLLVLWPWALQWWLVLVRLQVRDSLFQEGQLDPKTANKIGSMSWAREMMCQITVHNHTQPM